MADYLQSYPWYPGDWRGSRARSLMTLREQGLYRALLDLCFQDGSLCTDEEELRALVGCDKSEWRSAWPKVKQWFYEKDNRFYNNKVDAKRPVILKAKENRRKGMASVNKAREALSGQRNDDRDDDRDDHRNPPPSPSPSPSFPSGATHPSGIPEHTHTASAPEAGIASRCRIAGGCTSPVACGVRGACITEAVLVERPPEGLDGFEVEQLARVLHSQHKPFGDGGGLPATKRALMSQLAAIRQRKPGDSWGSILDAVAERHREWCEFWALDRQRDRRSFVPLVANWLKAETYRTEPAKAVPG